MKPRLKIAAAAIVGAAIGYAVGDYTPAPAGPPAGDITMAAGAIDINTIGACLVYHPDGSQCLIDDRGNKKGTIAADGTVSMSP